MRFTLILLILFSLPTLAGELVEFKSARLEHSLKDFIGVFVEEPVLTAKARFTEVFRTYLTGPRQARSIALDLWSEGEVHRVVEIPLQEVLKSHSKFALRLSKNRDHENYGWSAQLRQTRLILSKVPGHGLTVMQVVWVHRRQYMKALKELDLTNNLEQQAYYFNHHDEPNTIRLSDFRDGKYHLDCYSAFQSSQ